MIKKRVIYLRGKLTDHCLDNRPLRDQEQSLVAGSGVGNKREKAGLPLLFKAKEIMPKWAGILMNIG